MNEAHEMLQTNLSFYGWGRVWVCLECDRQIEMTLNPYKKEVIESGDENVAHWGGSIKMEISDEK